MTFDLSETGSGCKLSTESSAQVGTSSHNKTGLQNPIQSKIRAHGAPRPLNPAKPLASPSRLLDHLPIQNQRLLRPALPSRPSGFRVFSVLIRVAHPPGFFQSSVSLRSAPWSIHSGGISPLSRPTPERTDSKIPSLLPLPLCPSAAKTNGPSTSICRISVSQCPISG